MNLNIKKLLLLLLLQLLLLLLFSYIPPLFQLALSAEGEEEEGMLEIVVNEMKMS